MKLLERNTRIPKFLHELHGHRASIAELVSTYFTVFFITVILVMMAESLALPLFKWVIYVLLCIDLAGGAISNFTASTSSYYAESRKRRYIFISLHIIQPLLMFWIFPDEGLNILMVTLITLSTMLIVNNIRVQAKQRFFGAVFTMAAIAVTFALGIGHRVLLLLLITFIIKLVLSFAVRWD